MSAVESLRSGDLEAALSHLKEDVRSAPEDPRHRVFLFQLQSVLGDWKRALTQLNVARDLDPAALPMAQTYQEVLRCEVFRQQVFAGQRAPLIFGEPQAWVAQLVEALRHTADGQHAAADALRAQAFAEAPATPGQLFARGSTADAEPTEFAWIADADTRLGPLLEAIVNGKYYWVPFTCIQSLTLDDPTDLRDVVWMPATFTWTNGGEAVGMVPTRYAGTELVEPGNDDHNQLKLARRTSWSQPTTETCLGLGQRVLATDTTDFALLDICRLEMGPS